MNTNNYPNWLVPVELAERLKNAGFDEPCLVYSAKHIQISKNLFIAFKDEIEASTTSVYLKNCEQYKNSYFKKELKNVNIFSIPTYTQVFEWFINKGLVGIISTNEILNEGDPLYYVQIDDTNKNGNYYDIGYAKTYKEAREILVNNLIEIYKNVYRR